MQSRIRVGVLIFKDKRLLLVKHIDPKSGFTWWVPPGGGLKGEETIFECGEREVIEETNLKVKLEKVVYLRQFLYHRQNENNIDLYITSSDSAGEFSIKNLKGLGGDEHFIKELRFFSSREIKTVTVFPEFLKDKMWDDFEEGFPMLKFLGVEDDSKHG